MNIESSDDKVERETAELYVGMIRDEAAHVLDLYADTFDRQWEKSLVPRPRDTEGRKATAERPDPTADAALDPRRMILRTTVLNSQDALRDAAVTLRGVRRALEKALDRFDGASAAE